MLKLFKRLTLVLLGGLTLYALLGFIVLPQVALYLVNHHLTTYSHWPLKLEALRFDPFKLELEADGFLLGEAAHPQLAFERLQVGLDWRGLQQGQIKIALIHLERPQIQVVRHKDGQLNLSQWFKLPPSAPEDGKSTALPELWLDQLSLNQGQWRFEDQTLREPLILAADNLNLSLKQLSTRAGQLAELTLDSQGKNAPSLHWQGRLGINPLKLEGQLKLEQVNLQAVRGYLPANLPLRVEKGQLNLGAEVRLALEKQLYISLPQISVKTTQPLEINGPDKQPLLRLEALEISQTRFDLNKRQLQLGQVRLHALETWITREADGQLDWQKRFNSTSSNTSSSKATAQSATEPAWQLRLDRLQLRDTQIHLRDQIPTPAVGLEISALNLELKDFNTQGNTPFGLQLSARIGNHGRLKGNGQISTSGQGQLQVSTQDLDLRIAQSYLAPFAQLELRSGMLDSDLQIALPSTSEALRVRGQMEITQLHTLDSRKNQDLLKWQRLRLSGIDFQQGEQLRISRIDLVKPYARFVINPNLTTNLSEVLVKQSPPTPASSNPSTKEPPPLGLYIGAIQVIDGSAYFADLSLEPDFATSIQSLSGEIGTLNNRQVRPARVLLKGKVDRYSPMQVEGNINLLDPLNSLDLTTRFQQLEMTNLTPYSGKFAGYRIRKGRLDLDLHYQIQQRRLKAENRIVVHQLQLGERVDSPDAADIPVRLALALLKDSSGTITLDIPIQGNLDDPSFSVMPLLGKALGNLLTKAVQAPFRLLGALVEGDPSRMGQVAFAPGQAELDTEAKTQLSKLAMALQSRPDLMLEVEGSAYSEIDGLAMARQHLEREYRTLWYRTLQRRGEKVPASPDKLQVSDADKASMLDELYRARLRRDPPHEWEALSENERRQHLYQAVLQSWSRSQTLLRKLSQDRASAIKQYLASQGRLDNTRIYLLDSNLNAQPQNGQIFTPLYLAGQ